MRGAEAYLRRAAHTPSALLLHANSRLQGPWFDSTDWLAHVWVPQADKHYDVLTLLRPVKPPFDLQFFAELAAARCCLQVCRVAIFN